MLQAGYLEEWRWHETLSGAPQGGVCSPILSNIYLDTLDKFVETVLLPSTIARNGGARTLRIKAWRMPSPAPNEKETGTHYEICASNDEILRVKTLTTQTIGDFVR